MTLLHCVLRGSSLPTFPNHEVNMPDELISGAQVILCPFQYQTIILEDQGVAMDNLIGERLACEENTTVGSSCL